MGIKLQQSGRLKQAEVIYKQILREVPEHANSLHLLSLIAYGRCQFDLAGELIQKAICSNTSVSTYHYYLGCALKNQAKREDAARSFREALVLKPDFPEVVNNLGNLL